MSRANSLFCLTLHRMGVTWPGLLPNPPVVSYTTFSTLRSTNAVCFCGPIQKLTPFQVLPGIPLYGVRTFLTLGRARTSNQPEHSNHSRKGCTSPNHLSNGNRIFLETGRRECVKDKQLFPGINGSLLKCCRFTFKLLLTILPM